MPHSSTPFRTVSARSLLVVASARNLLVAAPARSLLVASAALLALAAAAAPQSGTGSTPQPPAVQASLARSKTVIVLRHAEKDAQGDPQDPHLGEAGQRRAQTLAALLRKSGASALFASEFHRTRDTLAPLAAALGLAVESVPARDTAALVKRIDALPPGATAVVAGHSNTVPAILAALGAELPGVVESGKPKNLAEDAFGRVFVVTLPPASAREHVAATTLELSTDP